LAEILSQRLPEKAVMTVTTSSLAEMSFMNFSARSLDGGEYFATGGSLRTRMKGAFKD